MRRAALVLTLVLAASAGTFLRAGQGAAPSQTPLPASNTALILGQVVDGSTGRPVPDAIVTLNMRMIAAANAQAADGGRGRGAVPPVPPAAPAVLTGGDGRFLFHDLPKGPAQLSITAPGYVNG